MKRFLLIQLILSLVSGVGLAAPVHTYTLVHPCMPLPVHAPVAGKYGCYSFSVALPGTTPSNAVFNWDFGNGATATGKEVLHCYGPVTVTTIFTGTVTFVSPALCGVQPTSAYFSITLDPPDSNSCIIPCAGILVSGKTVTLQSNITIPEVSVRVDFGDGQGWQPWVETHTYGSCGSFIVSREISSWFGGDTCTQYCAVNIPCESEPVGVGENSRALLSIHPNPAGERVTIRNLAARSLVQVSDLAGRPVLAADSPEAQDLSLDIGELSGGTYYIRVTDDEGSRTVFKLIKL